MPNDFVIGWEYHGPTAPKRRGRIYFHGLHFANIYLQDGTNGTSILDRAVKEQILNGGWCCNRDQLATEMLLPVQPYFSSPEAMLDALQAWYDPCHRG